MPRVLSTILLVLMPALATPQTAAVRDAVLAVQMFFDSLASGA